MTQHVARFERVSQGAPKSTDLEFAGGRLMESVMCPLSGFRKMLQIHSDCFRVHSCDLITSYYIIYYIILPRDYSYFSRSPKVQSHSPSRTLAYCSTVWNPLALQGAVGSFHERRNAKKIKKYKE